MQATARSAAFGVALIAMMCVKLVLVSDFSIQMVFSPHDDSLYAERALHLLHGEAFGPYDSKVLVKYPGFSIWLALVRAFGLPHLLSVNLLYLAGGLYIASALLRSGVRRDVLLLAMACWTFNPVTLGLDWMRLIREPLATGLLAVLIGAIAHILAATCLGGRRWPHLAVFSVVFAFSLYVREDDRLLWLLLGLFGLSAACVREARLSADFVVRVAGWVAVPAIAAAAYSHALHDFAERRYGLPVIHEFSEGEYPPLLAAIRSVESSKDNRMVMAPQDVLQKLRTTIPDLRPVIDRLPPPGPGTFSCRIHGVCSEWSNGWMPFWIKDAAYSAGLTPDLPRAQAYFARMRVAIEAACESGALRCGAKGGALVPPMEARWIRAYVEEAWRLGAMALRPQPNIATELPLTYLVDVDLGRRIQSVTMSDYFDALAQTDFRYLPTARPYQSPLGFVRTGIAGPFQAITAVLLLAGLIAVAIRLWIADRAPIGPAGMLAVVFAAYTLARLAILSYVAVYMGAFDPRMVFSTNAIGMMLAPVALVDTITAYRRMTTHGKG